MKVKRNLVVVDRTGKEWRFPDAEINLRNNVLEVHTSGALYTFTLSNLICYYILESEKGEKVDDDA